MPRYVGSITGQTETEDGLHIFVSVCPDLVEEHIAERQYVLDSTVVDPTVDH